MDAIPRREALGRILGAPALARLLGAAEQPARKLKVVVAGGHPGDPEYGCGGAVARYADLGHDVVLLYLNDGEPRDPGYKATGFRIAEAKRACEILRARPAFAGQIDGRSVVDLAHYEAFQRILEAERPDVVFTQWPIDNHRDHRAIADLVYEAWRRMGRKFALYYYEVSSGEDTLMFFPTDYVDITEAEPRKRAACYAHASQTPDRFYALQDEVARFRGIESGHKRAEAYIRHVQSAGNLLPRTP
jgi:LmbE family N-acetylglucosaminyl deacetylase